MKTSIYKGLLIFLIVSGSWIAGYSQQHSDSLLQYLEIAAKNNPTVLQKFTEYEAALQKVPQVGSLSDPEFSLGVFLKPMELVSGNQVADLRLMQMVPWFGVLRNAKDEMSLMANARFEIFRDAKLQLSYDLQKSWYDLYKIQTEITISEKNIDILNSIKRLALAKFTSTAAGSSGSGVNTLMSPESAMQNKTVGSSSMESMGANTINPALNQVQSTGQISSMASSSNSSGLIDLYSIEIEIGELENSIALLNNQKNSEIARFNSFLNRLPETPVFIGEDFNIDSLGVPLIAVSDSIIDNNPMLTMLEFEKQSVESRKKMVKAMGYPMLGVGVNYSLIEKTNSGMASPEMNGNDMIMPMLTVTLPVYRKKYKAIINETDLLMAASSLNYEATINELQTEYYKVIQLYKDAKRRIKLYENQTQLTERSFNIVLKQFSTSSEALNEVLRLRQQLLIYELKKVEAVVDLNTSVAWLRRLGNL